MLVYGRLGDVQNLFRTEHCSQLLQELGLLPFAKS